MGILKRSNIGGIENICWSALASALNSALAGAKEAFIITRTQYNLRII